MKNEEKKKGLFGGLFVTKKGKGTSGCCNIELEEIINEEDENVSDKETSKKDNGEDR